MVRPVVFGKSFNSLFHAVLDVDRSGNGQWAFCDVHDMRRAFDHYCAASGQGLINENVVGYEQLDVRVGREKLSGKFRDAGIDDE